MDTFDAVAAAARAAGATGRTPLVATGRAGGWLWLSWRESPVPGAPSHDAVAVDWASGPSGQVVRLVVADPAENAQLSDRAVRSARATSAVVSHARWAVSPADALTAASAEVCDPVLRPRQHNPLAAAAIVDLDPTAPRVLGAARAADCEVWTADRTGSCTTVFDGDMFTVEGRARFTDERSRVGMGPERWAAQERAVDDPSMWRCHSVGLVPDPSVDVCGPVAASVVLVSTDGLRLTGDQVAALADWVGAGIADVPADWPHQHPFGDLGFVVAVWAPDAAGDLSADVAALIADVEAALVAATDERSHSNAVGTATLVRNAVAAHRRP